MTDCPGLAFLKSTMDEPKPYRKPHELFASKDVVKVCAPMVRYSKLAFRMVVRKYDCDLAFTPMIISNSFVRSIKARDSDFTTKPADRPLIVQFAASNADDFATGTEIVAPYADGVDLNCGCPQRWAIQDGYGCCLLGKPNLLCDMLQQARRRVNREDFCTSMKIRLHKDLRQTVDLCQKAEKMGASFISIHGRRRDERCQPVDTDAIRVVKDSVQVPVIANGDIRTMKDVEMIKSQTGVDGVMSARGILSNPAMYAGFDRTPSHCIQEWVDTALSVGTPFTCFHHHLMYMMEHLLTKAERQVFNSLGSLTAVLDFLQDNYDIG